MNTDNFTADIIQFSESAFEVRCSFCEIRYTDKKSFDGFMTPTHAICHNCIEKCSDLMKKTS